MHYITDKTGMKIPRFSHIRKSHPRALGKDEAGADILGADTAKHHRLIRRGITYGSPLPLGNVDDGVDRGLLFLGYQASLHQQFEFIMSRWANDQVFPSLASGIGSPSGSSSLAGEDQIVGTNDNDRADPRLAVYPVKVVPLGSSVNLHTQDVLSERFVIMTGGGYFFCPGINALANLAG
jgi:deferrochelatase/peroxidase EfeB